MGQPGIVLELRQVFFRHRRPVVATPLSEVSIPDVEEYFRREKHSPDLNELLAPVAVAEEEPFVHP